jgi:hypothetical protein
VAAAFGAIENRERQTTLLLHLQTPYKSVPNAGTLSLTGAKIMATGPQPAVMQSAEDKRERPFRIQTAMVLFALEEALGSFVVQAAPNPESLPAKVRSEIETRIQGTGFVPVSQIVQETYLKEVIDLAVEASKGRAESDPLLRLRKLVETFDAFEIRNAVCHPNRAFPEFYWHRMAALATDPCIEQLRLLRVSDAFRCAVENRLTAPPDGWLQQRPWSVPNNLPSTFDHQVTGLIARQDEAKDLRKRLQNVRNSLVAIVGPGGTGKTALCLEVLRSAVLDPGTLAWADKVVYVTAKTERLTVHGIEAIVDPILSIDSVKRELAHALLGFGEESTIEEANDVFAQATTDLSSRRVIVCIDNLETLIRNHPQSFEDFVQSLPRDWRVVVTSRVSINGANMLSLGPIRREGATKLARDYVSYRGSQRLDDAQLDRLVDTCDCNPLAIRLAIDSYAAGTELSKALSQTRDRITEFAYTSLVDHLPADAGKLLECLFGSNQELSRGQIGVLLELSPDEVAEAMNSLLRTSLVTREADGATERYRLSSSVRELLLRSPRDSRTREEVYSRLRTQQRVLAELERTGTKDFLDESFVPVSSPAHVRALVARVRASVTGRATVADQVRDLVEVRRVLEFDADDPVLRRTEALLLEQLSDRYAAIEAFGKSADSVPSDACSRLRLAELLRDEQRLEEAVEQTQPLMDAGVLSRPEVSPRNKARIFRTHWVSKLWLGKHIEVLAATEGWRENAELRPAHVALRVSVLQRGLEGRIGTETYEEVILEILSCLSEGFRLDGYFPDLVHEGFKAFDRIAWMLTKGVSTKAALECAKTLDTHLPAMCGTSSEHNLSDTYVVNLVRRFRAVGSAKENPLRSERWTDLTFLGEREDRALAEVGYESARVTSVFPGRSYLFARAADGTRDFYVHSSATDLNPGEFAALRTGQLLSILAGDQPAAAGRAWPVKHVMLA